jgi:hypothetical protein
LTDTRAVIERYWATAGARDWSAYGALLSDDIVYEVPQTRERIVGRDAYLQFNKEYPGDWHIQIDRAVGEGSHGASWITFSLDGKPQPGITFFELDDTGRIQHIVDFWPEPYDPPPGRGHLVERY